jgi:hypothetical protein
LDRLLQIEETVLELTVRQTWRHVVLGVGVWAVTKAHAGKCLSFLALIDCQCVS